MTTYQLNKESDGEKGEKRKINNDNYNWNYVFYTYNANLYTGKNNKSNRYIGTRNYERK